MNFPSSFFSVRFFLLPPGAFIQQYWHRHNWIEISFHFTEEIRLLYYTQSIADNAVARCMLTSLSVIEILQLIFEPCHRDRSFSFKKCLFPFPWRLIFPAACFRLRWRDEVWAGFVQPTRTYLQQVYTDTGCSLEDLPGVIDERNE